jgi:hypothetical protein
MKTEITVEKAKNGFIISNATISVKIVATTEKAASDIISEDLSHVLNDMKDGDKKLIEFQITNS